jgi:hypothetical protein
MSTAECGCHVGPWWGVNPPPKCVRHRREERQSRDWTRDGWPYTAPSTPAPPTRDERDEIIRRFNEAAAREPRSQYKTPGKMVKQAIAHWSIFALQWPTITLAALFGRE